MVPFRFLLRKDMIVKDAIKVLKKKGGILSNVCVVDEDLAPWQEFYQHSQPATTINGTDQISAVMKTETPTFLPICPLNP